MKFLNNIYGSDFRLKCALHASVAIGNAVVLHRLTNIWLPAYGNQLNWIQLDWIEESHSVVVCKQIQFIGPEFSQLCTNRNAILIIIKFLILLGRKYKNGQTLRQRDWQDVKSLPTRRGRVERSWKDLWAVEALGNAHK